MMNSNIVMTIKHYDSELFEKMVARIHSILEGSGINGNLG